ncbi:permease-like cell division protein FtsX [Amedibacillus sp. YH-ame10]
MKKLYRYFKFYIKTTFRNITRHLGLTFSASVAVSITLILISVFSLISANLTNMTFHIEDQVTIRVSIDNIVKDDAITQLQNTIESIENVKSVTYSSGQDELNAYKEEYQGENSLFSMYDGENSPVRDAFIVEVNEPSKIENVTKSIKNTDGVFSAEYGGSSTQDLLAGAKMVRDGSIVFIVFLILIAVFLISNKIKMSIYTRKNEIAIMRFVGTSNWSVKFPMMLEGMCIGFFGAVVPTILTIAGYQYLYSLTKGEMMSTMIQLSPVYPLTIQISLLMIGIGVLVGFFGGFLSTTRYLRWKR